MPIFNLKHIFRLCKTLWYQFPRLTIQYSIEKKLFLQETKLKAKKLGHLDEKTAKNGHLYVQFSQKLLFKSKSHSLNAAHDQKILSLSENLFTKTAFLTFAFRSKCRVNKSTSCKKNREKTNTPLRVVKNHDVPNNSRYRFAAINNKNYYNWPRIDKYNRNMIDCDVFGRIFLILLVRLRYIYIYIYI